MGSGDASAIRFIIAAKSYVRETGKSMKAVELGQW
jgi:hypothetical protein